MTTESIEFQSKNPFKSRLRSDTQSIREALTDVPRHDICECAGFLRGFSQRELLSQDEREIIRVAAHILKILCTHL